MKRAMFHLKKAKKDRKDGRSDNDTLDDGDDVDGGSKKNRKCASRRRLNAATLRVQKDLSEIAVPETCELFFPDYDDYLKFYLAVTPDDGFYKGSRVVFSLAVPPDYPIAPPKVKCVTVLYHPNIDLEGNVCLNILREDWKPVLSISAVVYGLQFLLLEPNPDDPLNEDAALCLQIDKELFQDRVNRSMRRGGARFWS